MTAAVPVFLLLLLFAVQLTVNLYARSQVTGHSYDAARAVAGYRSTERRAEVSGAAEARLRQRLGRFGQAAEIAWQIGDESVSLRIIVRTPTVAPDLVRRAAGLDTIDRTITVRIEEPR